MMRSCWSTTYALKATGLLLCICLQFVVITCRFIYLGFYVTFNTAQVISRRVVGRAEQTSTYSSLGFCTVNCRPTASNYQLSHLRPCQEPNPGIRGGRRECYHSATVAPPITCRNIFEFNTYYTQKFSYSCQYSKKSFSLRIRTLKNTREF